MGAVDLVIQIESPTSVARGLQRIGRAGHQVDAPSQGVIFPKYRGDLLEAAVVAERMHAGAIEITVIPRNPLDVLAQQIVAMSGDGSLDGRRAGLRPSAGPCPSRSLSREALEGVLAMLAGAYPSDEFAELKARIIWDRVTGIGRGPARRPGRGRDLGRHDSRSRACSGCSSSATPGTPGRRVGELDEEMVYELRAGMHGDVVVLGASSWRVLEIGHDRVTVEPAPGVPGKLPFWHGDAVGRPIELGRAIGGLGPRARGRPRPRRQPAGRPPSIAWPRATTSIRWRPRTWSPTSRTSSEVAGALPTDRRIVVERFRDELGDWRLCLLTPFGGRVHAPWSLALEARLAERLGSPDPDDLVRRRDRDPAARGRAGRDRRGAGGALAARTALAGIEDLLFPTPTRSRTWSSAQLGELGPVRLPLPGERGPGPAPASPPAGHPDAALAAAPAVGRPAGRGQPLRQLPDPGRDLPRMPLGRLRPARAEERPGRRRPARDRRPPGRDRPGFALCELAPVRLRGRLHVRGRRADRRAPGPGADPRPRPAARAARPGGAARAARRRRPGRPRAAPPGPDRGPGGDDRRTSSTTCSAGWAT